MTHDAMTEHYEEITVCGKPALFTSIRIKRDTVPEGLYAYDVRHDDEYRGIPCEIAPFIMVNQWGTIILTEPLELPDDGRRYIDEDTDWNYAPLDGESTTNHKPCTTISDFMTAYYQALTPRLFLCTPHYQALFSSNRKPTWSIHSMWAFSYYHPAAFI